MMMTMTLILVMVKMILMAIEADSNNCLQISYRAVDNKFCNLSNSHGSY